MVGSWRRLCCLGSQKEIEHGVFFFFFTRETRRGSFSIMDNFMANMISYIICHVDKRVDIHMTSG